MKHTNREVGIFFILIAIVIVLVAPVHILAATPTPTDAVASQSADTAVIEELKQRLATKVAELRTLVKRAMFGTVKSVSVASATVETDTKDIKIELGDNVSVAQMIGGKRTKLTTDQISVGDPLTVFGNYDETLDLLKAQYIFIESKTVVQHVSGAITAVDKKNYTITIQTPEGRSVIADIENNTKTSAWDKTDGIVKSGFSKITVGDIVHVAGTNEPKADNRISAIRILDLGDLTGAQPTPTAEAVSKASDSATTKTSTPTP